METPLHEMGVAPDLNRIHLLCPNPNFKFFQFLLLLISQQQQQPFTPVEVQNKTTDLWIHRSNTKIRGVGGTTSQQITYQIILDADSEHRKAPVHHFTECRPLKPFRPLKLPDGQKFGIELELTSACHISEHDIARWINNSSYHSSRGPSSIYVDVIGNWGDSPW